MRYSMHYVVLFALFCGVCGGPADFWKKVWLSKHPKNQTEDATRVDSGRNDTDVGTTDIVPMNNTTLSTEENISTPNKAKDDGVPNGNTQENTDHLATDAIETPPAGKPLETAAPTEKSPEPVFGKAETKQESPEKDIKSPETMAPEEKEQQDEGDEADEEEEGDDDDDDEETSIETDVSEIFGEIAHGLGINVSKPFLMKFGSQIGNFFENRHIKLGDFAAKLNGTTLQDVVNAGSQMLIGGNYSRKRNAPENDANITTEAEVVASSSKDSVSQAILDNTNTNVPKEMSTDKGDTSQTSPAKKEAPTSPNLEGKAVDSTTQNPPSRKEAQTSAKLEEMVVNDTSTKDNASEPNGENVKNFPALHSFSAMLQKENDKVKSLIGNLTSPEALNKISNVFENLVKKQEEPKSGGEKNDTHAEAGGQAVEQTPEKSITKITDEYGTNDESDEEGETEEEIKRPELESITKEIKAMESTDFKNKQICNEYLGCFNIGAPWRTPERPCVVPQDPEKLKTRIYHFNGNHSSLVYEYPRLDIEDLSYAHNHDTFFIVHGLHSSGDAEWVQKMAGILKKKHGNVMVVEWSGVAHVGEVPVVLSACGNMRAVAREMAAVVRALHRKKGMKMSRTHCIGHSFGAHLCGLMGKNLTSTDLKLGSITALEAAQFPFEDQPSQVRLAKTDARTVVAHHSQAVPLGPGYTGTNIANINFYYNGGVRQPGCPLPDSLGKLSEKVAKTVFLALMFKEPITYDKLSVNPLNMALCSHNRVHDYFIEAISGDCEYLGYPFDPRNSIDGIVNGLTNGVFVKSLGARVNCSQSDDCLPVGLDFSDYPEFGVYEILTKNKPPFCLRDGDVMTREERKAQEMSLYGKFLTTYEKLLRFVLKL